VRWKLALVAALLGALTACDDHIIGPEPPVTAYCNRQPKLTYDNFGREYMKKWCTGCHSVYKRDNQRAGAPAHVNLNTWADVLEWAPRIQARSVDTTSMPPAAGISQEETNQLGEWLRCDVFPARNAEGIGS